MGRRERRRVGLGTLDAKSLREMADWAGHLQKQCLDAAEDAERLEAERALVKERRRQVMESPALLAHYLTSGLSMDMAVKATAQATGLEPEAIRLFMRKAKKNADRLAKEKRNRRILRLAKDGLSDREIGERLKLHQKSVARIISQERRRDW
jgi:DNA-binding NarL/FixJ family response regulator